MSIFDNALAEKLESFLFPPSFPIMFSTQELRMNFAAAFTFVLDRGNIDF